MIFITETRPSKSFTEKSEGVCFKFRRITRANHSFPAKRQAISTKIAIFGNFGKILAKIIQYRSKNVYENVY